MRTHGWAGATPATDEEAVERILDAASAVIDAKGAAVTISDVARAVGVTRQTVYRYFDNSDALMFAAAMHSVSALLNRIAAHVRGITDPSKAVVEGVVAVLEALPHDPGIRLLLVPDRVNALGASVTSKVAAELACAMLRRFDVDWAAHGYGEADLEELAEYLLRVIQSFVVDPGRPARSGVDLRRYLDRWVAPALRA